MAIDLSTENVTAKALKKGDDVFQLSAGKSLKIESSPDGEEHFDDVVPEGKVWNVDIFLKIEETDA